MIETSQLPTGTPGMVSTAVFGLLWAVKQAHIIPAKFLPMIACAIGILFVVWINGMSADNFVLGLVCGAGATGFHQTAKGFKKDKKEQE